MMIGTTQAVMKPISCPITSELIQSPEFSPNNGGWFESSLNGKREESSDGTLTSDDKFSCLYIQMELWESSLEYKLGEGKMEEKECWDIFKKIVKCLQYIHAKGFMHGDLSCSDVFFKENEVKIGDFGLARYLEEGGDVEEVHIDDTIDEPLIGQPPEKKVSVKYDIYRAGVILLRMLSLTVKYEKLDPYGTWVEKETFPPIWEDDLNNSLMSSAQRPSYEAF